MAKSTKRRKSASLEPSKRLGNSLKFKKKRLASPAAKSTILVATASVMKETTSNADPLTELQKLQKELAQMKETVEAQSKTIESVKQGLRCDICLESLRLPQLLVPCGHVACYECLKAWFLNPPKSDNESEHGLVPSDNEDTASNDNDVNDDTHPTAPNARRNMTRVKKHCPHCRVIVNNRPVPVYVLRGLVETVDPGDEVKDAPQSNDLWKDIFPPAKTARPNNRRPSIMNHLRFNSPVFRPDPVPEPFYDPEDGVTRCGVCMHEIWGHQCSNDLCGTTYEDNSDLHSDWEDNDDPWHGLVPYDPVSTDNFYEPSFIDDDDEDGGGDLYTPRDAHSVDGQYDYIAAEHAMAEYIEALSGNRQASPEPRPHSSSSRDRGRSSSIMEDEEDENDNGTLSTRSSEDFISGNAHANSFNGYMDSDEDNSEVDYWDGGSEHSQQSDGRDLTGESDTEEEAFPAPYSDGFSNRRRERPLRAPSTHRRVVTSDGDEDEDMDESIEEEEDSEGGSEDEKDEDDFLTPSSRMRNNPRRRIVSEDDDEDDSDSEPVRPPGRRR